ncbi:9386_t:CDS:2 [Funneliformis geosporum]|uniref:9386_t:CDS:1 n=1 Tax=Funneliformis geosporum TaxID=1117311 RepID=A0A9W4T797_9GLOM|nr:9386_t:CDS:2 [Funneliformis geosporum]
MATKTKPPYKSLLRGEAKLELDEETKKVWADFVKKAKKHKTDPSQHSQTIICGREEFAETRKNQKKFKNITNHPEYGLPNLADTIAHEITHCLIADYEPKQASQHDFTHAFITAILA